MDGGIWLIPLGPPRNRLGVSPVIATILMVAITVVLAAVLFALVQNMFAPTGGNHPLVVLGTPELQADGSWKVSVTSVSSSAVLGNFQVAILNGTAVGLPNSDVRNGIIGTQGSISVTFRDLDNGGTLKQGGFFIITGLKSGFSYEFDLSWKPGNVGVIAKQPIHP